MKERWYGEDFLEKIEVLKKNPKYTVLKPDLHKKRMTRSEMYAHYEKPKVYKFRRKSFKNEEANFSLFSPSTVNQGVLYQVLEKDTVQLDSVMTYADDLVNLKLKPVKKGEFLIKSWGCRYNNKYRIIIK